MPVAPAPAQSNASLVNHRLEAPEKSVHSCVCMHKYIWCVNGVLEKIWNEWMPECVCVCVCASKGGKYKCEGGAWGGGGSRPSVNMRREAVEWWWWEVRESGNFSCDIELIFFFFIANLIQSSQHHPTLVWWWRFYFYCQNDWYVQKKMVGEFYSPLCMTVKD